MTNSVDISYDAAHRRILGVLYMFSDDAPLVCSAGGRRSSRRSRRRDDAGRDCAGRLGLPASALPHVCFLFAPRHALHAAGSVEVRGAAAGDRLRTSFSPDLLGARILFW